MTAAIALSELSSINSTSNTIKTEIGKKKFIQKSNLLVPTHILLGIFLKYVFSKKHIFFIFKNM